MTDAGITVRKIGAGEVAAALAILGKWNMAPHGPTAEIPDPERGSLDLEHTFVALDGETVAGVCSYLILSAEEAETASLAVDPRWRGTGVGYALQVARLREMKARGFKRVRTETDRPETIDWYIRKFGYRVIGRNPKKHAFSLPDVDFWTVLELDLTTFA